MSFKSTLAASAAAFALIGGIAAAQETTGAVRGVVTDEAGAPISNATVVITDSSTGFRRSVTTGSAGEFSFRSLSVGGNYSIVVTGAGYQGEQIDDLRISLGETTSLSFDLASSSGGDTIVVVATRQAIGADLATGPSASFGLETLETAPSINRNLTDIIRIDPRIYVDESRGAINAVQCGGKNSRFNSLTVDGVRMNDNFGLNANGYPTERIPFSYDAIQEVAVELAPFDVQYGGFSACNINAVTKSGTNEFHGGVFYDFTNQDLRADSLEGDNLTGADAEETRWGINVGGPIIKDRLFFFAAYEKLDGVNNFDRGPLGSGAVNEIDLLDSEVTEILRIANDVYSYDPGFIPSSFDNEDEKILVKLDWNITDRQRASFTYNWNDGFNIVPSDGDNNEFEFSNHLYERGSELTSYVGSLYSDWTDNFSTEIRIGYSELDNRQATVGGNDFGEIRIELEDRELADGTPLNDIDVYIGGDDSRQSNKLSYETFNLALKGYYNSGNHDFSFGYEREFLDVFNLFIQHTETEIRFSDITTDIDGDGLDDDFTALEAFEQGYASAVYFNNSPSLNPQDAAGEFSYAINTLYVQDEYDFQNGLVVVAGLRYDWYETDDRPVVNQDFLASYGFGNDANLDGVDLWQPRVGFTWDASSTVDLRGGIGLYSGGNPNVWYANNFQNNNVLQFGQRGRQFGLASGMFSRGNLRNPAFTTQQSLLDADYTLCESGVPQGPGYCVPTLLADAVAGGTGDNFEINYLDPDFDLPSEWKFSLGGTFLVDMPTLGGEYVFTADALFTLTKDSAVWLRGDLEQVGTVTGDDGAVYPDFDSVREPAFVLTNSSADADSFLLSLGLSKSYDSGLDWALGYAYSDAEDVHPMTSSVAFSNYGNRAFNDPQTPVAATSDYNTKHRFTAIMNYETEFWADNATRLSAFGQMSSGRPYSLTVGNPNGITGFTPFLEGDPFLANGAERNGEEGSWWGKVDLKLEQDLPGLRPEDKSSVFVSVDNFTNLLNDEWGILREPGFPATCTLEDVDLDNCQSRIGDASRYEIRFGVRYEF